MAARETAPARRTARASLRGLASCLVLPLALSACISERQEQAIGDEMALQVGHQIPLVRDPLLNLYIARLGDRIVEVSGRPDLDYRFYLINSAMVNAFALPGGHVYVTRGLIERTSNASELAGVLAHEIGHVAARHGVDKLQRHLRTGSLVGMMYNLILGGEPAILQQNPTQLAGMLWSAEHSREDEREADDLAVEYMLEAGMEPEAVVTLLQTLLREEQQEYSAALAWFSTHPMTADRIQRTMDEIQKERKDASRVRAPALTSYPAFLRRVAALPPPGDASLPHP